VQDHEFPDPVLSWKLAEPSDSLGAKHLSGRFGMGAEQEAKQRAPVRCLSLPGLALLGSPEQLVDIADDPRPAELPYPVDDLRRMGATECQVAAVDDEVEASVLEFVDHGLEGGEVAVKIAENRDSRHWPE
jgi:hypothetical protein